MKVTRKKHRLCVIWFFLAANHCRLLRAKLWDIETLDEFAYVLDRIYLQTQSFDSPRIAVNFTRGRYCKFLFYKKTKQNSFCFFLVLNLRKKTKQEQYLSISNINEYSLIYKPLFDLPTKNLCLIIDISKATRRVSLEEKFRLERRSDHYICKMSKLVFFFVKFLFNSFFLF